MTHVERVGDNGDPHTHTHTHSHPHTHTHKHTHTNVTHTHTHTHTHTDVDTVGQEWRTSLWVRDVDRVGEEWRHVMGVRRRKSGRRMDKHTDTQREEWDTHTTHTHR